MAKLTKRQKKINEMLADFAQPTSAMERQRKGDVCAPKIRSGIYFGWLNRALEKSRR